jgi:hypothetical protein
MNGANRFHRWGIGTHRWPVFPAYVCCWLVAAALANVPAAAAQASINRLDRESAAQIARVIDDAAAAGLPVELLRARVDEGITKGASGSRIVAAVRAYAASLGEARTALRGDTNLVDLDAAASALRVGASAGWIGRVRAFRQTTDIATPLVVFVDLVKRGIPVDTVSAAVLAVVAAGSGNVQLQKLQSQVARESVDGRDATASLRAFLRSQPAIGTDPKPPATKTLPPPKPPEAPLVAEPGAALQRASIPPAVGGQFTGSLTWTRLLTSESAPTGNVLLSLSSDRSGAGARSTSLTGSLSTPLRGTSFLVARASRSLVRDVGWAADFGALHDPTYGSRAFGSLGAWLRHSGVLVSLSTEREIFVSRTMLTSAANERPFVVSPVKIDTLAIPHDTLTPSQAAARIASRDGSQTALEWHFATSAVMGFHALIGNVLWETTVGHPFSRCCRDTSLPMVFGTISVTRPVAPIAAIVLSAGSLANATQVSSPQNGAYVKLGVDLHRRVSVDSAPTINSAIRPILSVDPLSNHRFVIRITAPTARTVELRGDATGWTQRGLSKAADGSWELQLVLLPGLHRISVRFDGGPWNAPEGLPRGADDFGDPFGVIMTR